MDDGQRCGSRSEINPFLPKSVFVMGSVTAIETLTKSKPLWLFLTVWALAKVFQRIKPHPLAVNSDGCQWQLLGKAVGRRHGVKPDLSLAPGYQQTLDKQLRTRTQHSLLRKGLRDRGCSKDVSCLSHHLLSLVANGRVFLTKLKLGTLANSGEL